MKRIKSLDSYQKRTSIIVFIPLGVSFVFELIQFIFAIGASDITFYCE